MCDAFLVLAQAPGGLTCFLMPRFRPDGHVNGLHFQRLKDKLGNRSNASSEVEFVDAFAWRVGEEGRGVRTIIEMVQLTRLDCAISSSGMMRMAVAQAVHHALAGRGGAHRGARRSRGAAQGQESQACRQAGGICLRHPRQRMTGAGMAGADCPNR